MTALTRSIQEKPVVPRFGAKLSEPGMKERLYIMQSAIRLRWLLYVILIGMMIFPLGLLGLFSGKESLSEAWLTGMLQSFPAPSYLE